MSPANFLSLVLAVVSIVVCSAAVNRPIIRLGDTRDPHVRTYFDLNEHIAEIHRELDKVSRLAGVTPTCDTSSVRLRQEIGDISQATWDAYGQAVIALRNSIGGSGLNAYEQFAEFHSTYASEAHGSVKFLPWHRWFLYYYETALRQFDSSVTIPYWNWARDAGNPRSSLVFTSIRQGSARDGQDILDGVFRGWSSAFPSSHSIARWLDPDIFLENEVTVNALVTGSAVCRFMNQLEVIHGFPHIFVGGGVAPSRVGSSPADMALVARSPNDPIFFNHHAFVDKIWDDYLKRKPKAWCSTTWSKSYTLLGVGKTVGSAVNGFNACVQYSATIRSATSVRVMNMKRIPASDTFKTIDARLGKTAAAQAIDIIQSSVAKGDKAGRRAGQAALWAALSKMDPMKAQQVAATISRSDPTTQTVQDPPVFPISMS